MRPSGARLRAGEAPRAGGAGEERDVTQQLRLEPATAELAHIPQQVADRLITPNARTKIARSIRPRPLVEYQGRRVETNSAGPAAKTTCSGV
jgi:hypothetical protein